MRNGVTNPKMRLHPLMLQRLPVGKFSETVNDILQGKQALARANSPHTDRRVLVADDNEDHRQQFVDFLESDLGVQTDIAATPPECLKKIYTIPFHLLILDYRLPKHDGLWVIDQLCTQHRRVPVMMVTSFYTTTLEANITAEYGISVFSKSTPYQTLIKEAGRLLAVTRPSPLAA